MNTTQAPSRARARMNQRRWAAKIVFESYTASGVFQNTPLIGHCVITDKHHRLELIEASLRVAIRRHAVTLAGCDMELDMVPISGETLRGICFGLTHGPDTGDTE